MKLLTALAAAVTVFSMSSAHAALVCEYGENNWFSEVPEQGETVMKAFADGNFFTASTQGGDVLINLHASNGYPILRAEGEKRATLVKQSLEKGLEYYVRCSIK